ncbi:glycosyl hydrolase [Mucilaginibacter celer]|nr:glycosyl hydrolase [Mucilaginibacter celer]
MNAYTTGVMAQSKNFVWGINGHPLTQRDYSNNIDQQISALTDLGVNSYRFDVLLDAEGNVKKESAFLQLLARLKARNIAALPALMQSGLKGTTATDNYNKGYSQGYNFGIKYGSLLSVIEVNNEVDNKIRYRGKRTGGFPEYDTIKASRFINAIKGFIDGVKAVKPGLLVTLSVSYTHFYYLKLLQDNHVNYDIIGCHWYSNMGDIAHQKQPFADVLTSITTRFNKPVWITEFNYFRGTTKVDFATQNDYITRNISKLSEKGIIKGFFVYELFDQPALKARYPDEGCYGIMYKDTAGNYQKKDAYNGFKQAVSGK